MIRVVDLNKDNNKFEESVIGLGNFDGIHLGHQNIIESVVKLAKIKGIKSSVLVFKQHTNEIFPHFPPYYISSLEDKIEILDKFGIDIAYTIDFTYEFSKLSNDYFILDFIKDKLKAQTIVCGKDYTYGKNSLGTVKQLQGFQESGQIEIYIVDEVLYGGRKISSTDIRKSIYDGNFPKVKELLTYNFTIRGKIEHGFNRGTKLLGFPTANLSLDFSYIIPKDGLYITNFILNDNSYPALTSIGTNPTFSNTKDVKIETYILDFKKDIYGKEAKIEFLFFLRKQFKFNTFEDLISQMKKDEKEARKFFNI